MNNFSEEQQYSNATPSIQDLAALMNLDLATDDPVMIQNPDSAEDLYELEPFLDTTINEEDDDIFDDEEFDPEKNQTKVTLQHNGVAKAAVVSGASLAVILGGVMLFQSQIPQDQVAQTVNSPQPSIVDDKVATAQAAATKAQQSESETKAQLALAKQKDSLAQATQQINYPTKRQSSAVAVATTAPTPQASSTNTPIVVAAPISKASWTVAKAPRKPIVQPIAIATPTPQPSPSPLPLPRVQKQPTPKPVQIAAAPAQPKIKTKTLVVAIAPTSSKAKTAKPPVTHKTLTTAITVPGVTKTLTQNPIDPNTELQQLAAVGRYGAVTAPVEVPSNLDASPTPNRPNNIGMVATTSNLPPLAQYFQQYATSDSLTPTPTEADSPLERAENGARPAFSNSQSMIKGESVSKAADKAETSVKNESGESITTIKTLLVGTSAKGSAMTPVLWGGGASSSARFMLKLDEPMLDGNNRQAFPAGTQFVVTAKPASANIGLAELEVVSVIIKGMEFAPPAGAIVIRDDQGGLLIGEDYFKREEQIANRDLMTVFSGALGGVGRIMNQPISTSASGGNGTFVNTVTNREPNILGGILEGGFKDLSAVWSQRNQEAIQELLRKPNVYQIPRGRAVRVFVNQSMTF